MREHPQDLELARRELGVAGDGRAPGALDQLAHPHDQLLQVDGLAEVVVGADEQPGDAVGGLAAAPRHEHDRQLRPVEVAQLAADLVPGDVGEVDLDHRDPRRVRGQRDERVASGSLLRRHVQMAKPARERRAEPRVGVDQ